MPAMNLPREFVDSYKGFESYPTNVVYKGAYHYTLESSRQRLNESSSEIFTEDDNNIDVRFRDLSENSQVFYRGQIRNDQELKTHLGDRTSIDPLSSTLVGDPVTKRDPKCRFIFLYGGNTRTHLKATRQMFIRMTSYHQVMPAYLNFISVFGQQERARDLRFSGFQEQTLLESTHPGSVVTEIGRNGRQYQLCYNLKAPSKAIDQGSTKWSIRQAAIHHQFDVETGTALWLITKGDFDPLKKRIEHMTGVHGRPEDRNFTTPEDCFRSSLAVVLLLCHWSTEDWRWFITYLEDTFDRETKEAVENPRGREHIRRLYQTDELQGVQGFEDRVNEAVMVLEANIDILNALKAYYEGLLDHTHFPMQNSCRRDIKSFAAQLNDMIYDSKMQISRTKLLVRLIGARKTMILQHLSGQTNEVMEDLTKSMYNLGIMSQTEAIAMRIITVVTLLYLPATFVSTFFSTDVIKYQNQNGSNSDQPFQGSFSKIALDRWLQVTLPLTFVTISIAYYFFRRAAHKAKSLSFMETSLPYYTKPVSYS